MLKCYVAIAISLCYCAVEPCQSSPLECITGICYANYTGCRITGTYIFNFTNDNGHITTTDCLYSPTSSSLSFVSGLTIILLAMMILVLGAMSITYFMFKYVCVNKK